MAQVGAAVASFEAHHRGIQVRSLQDYARDRAEREERGRTVEAP
jgi:hypothetical protein